ncbi:MULTISPECIES: CGNR zinc finger domain-containing protein [unclassified Amycolatopsis]|uniref:CGNR zinc finger domain-containing protein n=1 Tax=unclassified Amycolatopsis TaxID=2618356 RepID=UPI0021039FEF|nr:CGNR zinc finger domain-containing protein [Amycolatopsis sp. DSM 110486]
MTPNPSADPRPLVGEPMSIDLHNTRWLDDAGNYDLLDGVDGMASWFTAPLVRQALGKVEVQVDAATLDRLLQARSALDGLLAALPNLDADAVAGVNAVLEHGRLVRSLSPDGPVSTLRLDDPSWGPAWVAVDDYLRLLGDRPERIRHCANPECVLYFYDVSKNGTRRWCSMSGCGNRAKSMRHYRRVTGK